MEKQTEGPASGGPADSPRDPSTSKPRPVDTAAHGTERWLARARAGDRDAQASLARSTYSRLLTAARAALRGKFKPLRGRLDTRDLVQSTYGEALRSLPSYRPSGRGSFLRWLKGILRNKARRRMAHFFGAARRDARRELPLEHEGLSSSAAESPSRRLLYQEDRARMRSALARLPDDQRGVLEYRYFQDLPWKEVAIRLGRSEEAAQMLCSRALRKLRGLYESGS